MHFVSLVWFAWLAGTVAMYWIIPHRWRDIGLILVSLAFLAVHAPGSALLLASFSLLTYACGKKGEHHGGHWIVLAAVVMLSVLIYYKVTVRASPEDFLREVLIPMGLSYYSFRCFHYLLERFRGTLPSHTFQEFLSYLFFLPTMVVGPIHRFTPFLHDHHTKEWRSDTLSEGMERILYGYVKVAVLANFLFSTQMTWFIGSIDPQATTRILYLEMIRGAMNLYLQFSGFSDIAIGFALLLGYRVMENFNNPYGQRNIADFWRSWHMSLSSWCRDYVYLPMIGLTRNPYVANITAFLVIGLWHEVSLRFVVWALYHATGVIIWREFQTLKRKLGLPRLRRGVLAMVVHGASIVLTFHFVGFGFTIARQPTLAAVLESFRMLFLFWW
jgi:D-alanyl-lipoteichoic acid acyltransferase DltB (MBOAT superfamily)